MAKKSPKRTKESSSEPALASSSNGTPSWLAPLLLVVLTFLLYGNSIPNDYALDDAIVITENIYTQEGAAGLGKIFTTDAFEGYFQAKKNLVAGGRYRPLSIATFALEIEVFGASPGISHFFNVLLFALSAILLFSILRMLLPGTETKKWWAGLPFLICLLYIGK